MLTIDGHSLTTADVARVARNPNTKVVLADEARQRLSKTRAYMESNFMHDDAPLMYSFNTGVGLFKDQRVQVADMVEYQTRTVYAHATGVGEPLPEDATRATMLLRANAFASNFSGPRVEVLERLLDCLNAGLHPVIPQKGSVGASGDLAPLAHMSGAICGFPQAEMIYRGERLPAREALKRAGLSETFSLSAKDASALINGSTVSLALAALAFEDAKRILKHADVAMAMTLECMRGELAAFDPRIHAARPHHGQAATARNILRITVGTKRCSEDARRTLYPDESRKPDAPLAPRVQDVYSLRCTPQVHGPFRDALAYVDKILAVEVNSATDNPLLVEGDDGHVVCISGGHFHGQYIAQAMDLLAIATTDIGAISERRLARLIDPTMSYGLPRNLLSGKRGLNTGYATVQCSMSALVMENRTLSTPGSVDSIPGKSNAEDHVSNSTWCGRKARTVVENVEQIVAGEILMAGQALTLVEPLSKDHPIGKGSQAALASLRKVVEPALDGDRWYQTEMIDALNLLRSGALVEAVEASIGILE